MTWMRQCIECGNEQEDKEPLPGELTDAYANRVCKECGSPGLDYGSDNNVDEDWANEEDPTDEDYEDEL